MASFATKNYSDSLNVQSDNTGPNNQPLYVGEADPKTPLTAARWRIKKLAYDGNNVFSGQTWANGDNSFSFVWNSRTTYTYTT